MFIYFQIITLHLQSSSCLIPAMKLMISKARRTKYEPARARARTRTHTRTNTPPHTHTHTYRPRLLNSYVSVRASSLNFACILSLHSRLSDLDLMAWTEMNKLSCCDVCCRIHVSIETSSVCDGSITLLANPTKYLRTRFGLNSESVQVKVTNVWKVRRKEKSEKWTKRENNEVPYYIKKNSMVRVRERTIPTERPPLVGEVIANFCG
jgi:hypothetical protein